MYAGGPTSSAPKDRGWHNAWRACCAEVDGAPPELPEVPLWAPGADADRQFEASLGLLALPVLRVCKQWRSLLWHEFLAKVVVCAVGQAVPRSTEVLILVSPWPRDDDDDDEIVAVKAQLAHLSDLPRLTALAICHIPDYQDRQRAMLPELPSDMRSLKHLLYVDLAALHSLPIPKSRPGVYEDVTDSIAAMTRLETLLLPELDFHGEDEQSRVSLEVYDSLPALSTLFAPGLIFYPDSCSELTGLTSLHISVYDDSAVDPDDPSADKTRLNIAPLSELASLKHLCLSARCDEVKDIVGLHTLTQLRSLELRGFDLPKDNAAQFSALTALDALTIGTSSMDNDLDGAATDEALVDGLSSATVLPSLTLSVASRGNMTPLAALTSLRSLTVSMAAPEDMFIHRVESEDLHLLSALTSLTSLCIVNCDLGIQGTIVLMCVVQLRQLRLVDCSLLSSEFLRGLTALQDLRLDRYYCLEMDDGPGGFLGDVPLHESCPGLTTLQLVSGVCEPVGRMAEVAKCSELRELDVMRADVTAADLAELRSLEKLQALQLNACRNITSAGLRHLTVLRSLQCVAVRSCGIRKDADEVQVLMGQGVLVDCGRQSDA